MSGKNFVTFFSRLRLLFSLCPTFASVVFSFFFLWVAFVLFAFYEPQYNVLISLGGKIQFLISDFVIVSFVTLLLMPFQPVSSSSSSWTSFFLMMWYLLFTLKCITKNLQTKRLFVLIPLAHVSWLIRFFEAKWASDVGWAEPRSSPLSFANQDIIWKSITFLLALI